MKYIDLKCQNCGEKHWNGGEALECDKRISRRDCFQPCNCKRCLRVSWWVNLSLQKDNCNPMTQPELKPCAFCGKKPQSKADLDPITYGWSIKCCGRVRGENELVSTEKWNSAYCWKELEKLKDEKEAYREIAIDALCAQAQKSDDLALKEIGGDNIFIPRREHSRKLVEALAAKIIAEKGKVWT